jgi:hypothetical protein
MKKGTWFILGFGLWKNTVWEIHTNLKLSTEEDWQGENILFGSAGKEVAFTDGNGYKLGFHQSIIINSIQFIVNPSILQIDYEFAESTTKKCDVYII